MTRKSRKTHRLERQDIATILNKVLFEKILVRDGNRVRHISRIEAASKAVLDRALLGDHRAFAEIVTLAVKLRALMPPQEANSEAAIRAELDLWDKELELTASRLLPHEGSAKVPNQ